MTSKPSPRTRLTVPADAPPPPPYVAIVVDRDGVVGDDVATCLRRLRGCVPADSSPDAIVVRAVTHDEVRVYLSPERARVGDEWAVICRGGRRGVTPEPRDVRDQLPTWLYLARARTGWPRAAGWTLDECRQGLVVLHPDPEAAERELVLVDHGIPGTWLVYDGQVGTPASDGARHYVARIHRVSRVMLPDVDLPARDRALAWVGLGRGLVPEASSAPTLVELAQLAAGAKLSGTELTDVLANHAPGRDLVDDLVSEGLICLHDGMLRPTPLGEVRLAALVRGGRRVG